MPDRHATSWKNPCWICGRVNSHDHTTAEWTAAEWAVAAERARIRAAVQGLPKEEPYDEWDHVRRDHVLAIIDPEADHAVR